MSDFELLEVQSEDGVTYAKPRSMHGLAYLEALSRDLELLATTGELDVRLDLRSAEVLSSGAIGSWVRLHTTLEAEDRKLTVMASHRVVEVMRVIRLTGLFKVVTEITVEMDVHLLDRLDEWCQRTSCNRAQAIDDSLRMLVKR